MKKFVLFLVMFALFVIPTQVAARGGYHGGGGGDLAAPCLLGGLAGLFFLGAVAAQPAVIAPPAQCLRVIPGYWGAHWNPYLGRYVRIFVPAREVLVPCQ